MSSLARHLRALVIALAVLALSATVVLGARGLPSLTAALAGPGTTVSAPAGDDQGEDADDPGDDADAPDEDAAEDADADPDADADAPEASEDDGSDAPDADTAGAETHGSMVSTAAGMDTPDGFANHG